jgi:PadR family transcriptional regulator PadR
MAEPRMTPQTIAVLRALLEDPTTPRYGLDIARQAGLKTGTLHPILRRLQQAGLIESFWEDPADHEDEGRPRRRYYRFTGHGATTTAYQAVARADADAASAAGVPALRPQPGH